MNNNVDVPPESKAPKKLTFIRILVLIAVIAISTYIVLLPEEHVRTLEGYGYIGIFLISILSNATVLIPAPGLIIVFSLGARFNPFLVGIFAGTGAAIGELSGYMAGFSGQALVENSQRYQRLTQWMKRNGPLTVMISAFIPNPVFDLTGIIAGILKMPISRFLIWAAIGKILKMTVIAMFGYGLI